MIKRIELINFMSHKHTVIEPADGLTVLVGPNNCGKSAIVAALQILCHNENSTYVTRHDARDCAVRVETDDGHVVEWQRKNSPRYLVDGELFDRLGKQGVPEKLHEALRLAKVETEKKSFDIHFGSQKSPIFLIDEPSEAAQFFASSSDAIKLVEMQSLHRRKLTDAQRDKNRFEAESVQLNRELEILEPVADVDAKLAELERTHEELVAQGAHLKQALKDQAALIDQSRRLANLQSTASALADLAIPPPKRDVAALARLQAQLIHGSRLSATRLETCRALAPLPTPPALADVNALDRIANRLAKTRSDMDRYEAVTQRLNILTEVPVLPNHGALANIVSSVKGALKTVSRWQSIGAAVSTVPAAPIGTDVRPISDLLGRLTAAQASVDKASATLALAEADLEAAAKALETWASSRQICPTCGGTIDSATFLAHVGAGGHAHG